MMRMMRKMMAKKMSFIVRRMMMMRAQKVSFKSLKIRYDPVYVTYITTTEKNVFV